MFTCDVKMSPPHGRMQCPAKEAVCHNCSVKGHFKSMCRSRGKIGDLYTVADEISFLGTVRSVSDVATANRDGQPWIVSLYLNSRPRVNVMVIPESAYSESLDGPLSPPSRVLRGPGQPTLQVRGKFEGKLEAHFEKAITRMWVRDLHVHIHVHVCSARATCTLYCTTHCTALLGRPAIESLRVVISMEPVLTATN